MIYTIEVRTEISVVINGLHISTGTCNRDIMPHLTGQALLNSVSLNMLLSAHRAIAPALENFKGKFEDLSIVDK